MQCDNPVSSNMVIMCYQKSLSFAFLKLLRLLLINSTEAMNANLKPCHICVYAGPWLTVFHMENFSCWPQICVQVNCGDDETRSALLLFPGAQMSSCHGEVGGRVQLSWSSQELQREAWVLFTCVMPKGQWVKGQRQVDDERTRPRLHEAGDPSCLLERPDAFGNKWDRGPSWT